MGQVRSGRSESGPVRSGKVRFGRNFVFLMTDIMKGSILRHLSEMPVARYYKAFCDDKELIMASLRWNSEDCSFIGKDSGLHSDREVLFQALRAETFDQNHLQCVGSYIKDNKALLIQVIKERPMVCLNKLVSDADVITALLQSDGQMLRFLGRKDKDNCKYVKLAVQNDGSAYRWAGDKALVNKSLVLFAMGLHPQVGRSI